MPDTAISAYIFDLIPDNYYYMLLALCTISST